MTLRFLLVCEGSSDTGLLHHIQRLLVSFGYDDPQGNAWYYGNPLAERIRQGVKVSGDCDLILIHRDADSDEDTQSAGPNKRIEEIEEAVLGSGYAGPWAPVVPVLMTETWLLVDGSAIRQVAGRPSGSLILGLPSLSQVENQSDPKGCLERALLAAGEPSGKRNRAKFIRDIPRMRRSLLEKLPVGGPLEQVPSWLLFRENLSLALATMETT